MKRKLIRLIEIPVIHDDCELIVAQNSHIPFKTQRTYWILNANTKFSRGYHAHKKTDQVLFCLKGKVKVTLDDGKRKESITLTKYNVGVLINRMVWHEMHNFEKNTILLVIASLPFDPGDYVRNNEEFKKLLKE